MLRSAAAFFLSLTLALMSSPAFAQDGILKRAGDALDNAGREHPQCRG